MNSIQSFSNPLHLFHKYRKYKRKPSQIDSTVKTSQNEQDVNQNAHQNHKIMTATDLIRTQFQISDDERKRVELESQSADYRHLMKVQLNLTAQHFPTHPFWVLKNMKEEVYNNIYAWLHIGWFKLVGHLRRPQPTNFKPNSLPTQKQF